MKMISPMMSQRLMQPGLNPAMNAGANQGAQNATALVGPQAVSGAQQAGAAKAPAQATEDPTTLMVRQMMSDAMSPQQQGGAGSATSNPFQSVATQPQQGGGESDFTNGKKPMDFMSMVMQMFGAGQAQQQQSQPDGQGQQDPTAAIQEAQRPKLDLMG